MFTTQFSSRSLMAAMVAAVSACTPAPTSDPAAVNRAAVVANGGFEADAIGVSPASWTVEKYLNNGLLTVPARVIADLNLTTNAGGLNTFVVGGATVESQTDPDLGAAGTLRFPKFGTRSVVINPGNANQGPSDAQPTGRNRSVNSMKQSFTLTNGDIDPIDGAIHVRFVAAPVLQNPTHTADQQPYFFVQVRNVTRNVVLYKNFNFAGQAGVAWKTVTIAPGNDVQYTDWQLIDVAPGTGAAVGDQLELIVFGAGCSLGGHWGRVYVDSFGATIPGLYVSGTAQQSLPNNSNLTYTLNYRNGSAVGTTGTSLTFNTPPNTTFVSTTGAGCTTPTVGTAGTITCPLGALAAGAGGSLAITVLVNIPAPAAGGTLLTAQNYWVQATGVNPLLGSKIDTIVYSGPATLTVISGSPQSATVNTSFGADLVVEVRDATNTVMPDIVVNFTAPGAGASASFPVPNAITSTTGRASLRPTANTVTGTYTATASVPGIAQTGSFTLTNTAGAPASISVVSGTPQSATVNTAFAAPLVVVVRDQFGNPVPGATVTVTRPATGASATTSVPAVTNASGQTQVTATANTVAGAYTVTFAVAGVATPASFALTNNPGAAASITVVSGSPQTATVTTAFANPMVVVVRDQFGNAVPGANVTFTPPASGASAALSSPAVTNASGQTQVTATANATAGAYTITASVAGVATPASFSCTNSPGAPASVTITNGNAQSTRVQTTFTNPLVLVVRDAQGNPVPNVVVTFTAPAAGASSTFAGSTTTNASGVVSIAATANTIAGSYTVTATVAGVATPASFALTNTPGPAASIAVVSGSPQSHAVNGAFTNPLVVVVRDQFGNAVPGATVTFTAPASGASATLSPPAVTNAAGQTQVTATANGTAGAYVVTASTNGQSTTFSLTNTAGAPASVGIVSGGTAQSTVVLTAFAQPLTVVVRDANNNVVPGVTVTYAGPASGASATFAGSTTTNAAGQTVITATANRVAGGPYTVTATVAGLAPASFTLTNLAGPAAAIAVVSGSSQSTAITTAFPQPLVVVVTDAQGNPVPNATVTFTPPASGASASTSGTTTTNDQGQVSVTATANGTAGGPYSVTAAVAGVATPATFALTNSPLIAPVITSPAQNAVLTDPTPDLSGTSGPNAPITVYADGGTTPVCVTTANAAGMWTCTVSPALADGPHTFVATTTNGSASASSAPRTVIIDSTPPPEPIITAPTEGATTSPSPTISGSAEPGSTVSIYLDGSSTPACTAVADAAGAFSCIIVGPLPPGAHHVTADARDAAGNVSPATPARNFTVATSTPPGPPIIASPTRGQSTSDTTPTISGTATPGSEVRVYIDGSSTPACVTTASSTGAWSCEVSPALAEGPHTVAATATTAAGTSAPSAITPFTVDTTAPVAPVITAPAANATTSSTPVYAGTSEPNATVSVFVDGGTTPVCIALANAAGEWTCTSATPLSAGAHTVTASAADRAGNTSPLTAPTPFTVGNGQPPSAPVITAPVANSSGNDPTPAFEGTATPGATVKLYVDGGSMPVCTAVADSTGHFICSPTTPLADGPHQVTATATTSGGTSANSQTVPFTIDTMAPLPPVITGPTAGQTTGPTPTITGTAEAGSTVTVRIDGQVVCEVVATAAGTWSCPVTRPLAPGMHSVTASATDPAGNRSMTSAATPFTVAGAPSTPVLQQPAAGSTVSTRTPTFTGLGDPGSSIEVSVDGKVVCTTTADATGHFSCAATTPLSEGAHTATVKATTPSGSASSTPSGFTVGSGPVVVSPTGGATTGQFPTFTGTATPNGSVSVVVDGEVVCSTQAADDGTWTCTPASPLAAGSHDVKARDGANESSTTTIFVVIRSLSGAGLGVGCASTGGTPGPWLVALLLFAALLGRRRRGALAVGVLVVGSTALAQTATVPTFELERVRLNGGAQHGLLVESADLLPKFEYRAALTFHYEQDPLVAIEDGKRVGSVVGSRIGLHVSGAFSITDWLDVSLQLPIVLSQTGNDLSSSGYAPIFSGVAAGTPWVGARGALLQERRGSPLDLSLGVALGLPIGYSGALTRDNAVSAIPSVGIGKTLSSFLRLGGSVSVLIRNAQTLTPASTVADEVGSLIEPAIILSTLGDGLRGELSTRIDFPFTRASVGAEIDLGLRYPLFDLLEVYAVGGPGFGALPGTPTFRILAGIALAPRAPKTVKQACVAGEPHDPVVCPELDLDGDGVPNGQDECPTVLGLASRKGCPDIDTDRDGVLDSVDACPTVPGPVARKGCPEPDADGDGVPDATDACPNLAGPAAKKGCPDTDGDGLTDDVDACPKVAGVVELKGCPDVDTDGDGVVDRLDACRTEKGVKENEGCPAKQKQLVVITRDRLVIKEKVNFATGKSDILPKSFPLLEQISKILKEHPEVERVSVEGHTDSRGNHDSNVKLSQARAESVRQWLLKAGIAADRMTAKGFGPDKPLATNETDAGREANRRVEFVIVGAETVSPPKPVP